MVASGAPWESAALRELTARPTIVVLKRCMDVTDLMATAATGQADGGGGLARTRPGLDPAAVDHLHRHGVRPVAVVEPDAATDVAAVLARLGLTGTVDARRLDRLPDAVLAAAAPADDDAEPDAHRSARRPAAQGASSPSGDPAGRPAAPRSPSASPASWPGAALDPLVLDADPWGGAVGQHLGVLDEVSGLLAGARLHPAGELPGAVHRPASGGSARGSGWSPACPGPTAGSRSARAPSSTLARARPPSGRRGRRHRLLPRAGQRRPSTAGRPGRNAMTLEALEAADEVVVVGAADPVGLSRLARGLVELHEHTEGRPVQVVVNRMRAVAGLVGGATSPGWSRASPPWPACTSCPTTAAAVDRALVAGRTLVEGGDSPLTRGLVRARRRPRTPSAPRPGAGAGSGAEQQVEPADREADHHHQQRQLTGELVPLRQQLDGAVVRGDHGQHVADDHRQPPW